MTKQTIEHIRKRADARKRGQNFNCLICANELWRSPAHIKKGDCKFCSRECYQKWQRGKPKNEAFKEYCRSRTGSKSPTWRGGITPEHIKIRNSRAMSNWRNAVFERDNYICQDCKKISYKKSGELHAHHLQSFSEHPNLRFEVNNGISLCKKCHYVRHTNQENRTS